MFLNIQDISVVLAENEVLRDVSFTVGHKEVLVIVGQNGCGKSTLLQVIAGLRSPNSGVVEILGQDVIGLQPSENPACLLPPFLQHLKVGELVGYELRRRYGVRGNALRSAVRDALQKVFSHGDVEKFMSRRRGQLSAGERRKVQLAAMLAALEENPRPAVLLLDEPTDAVDALTRPQLSIDIIEAALSHGDSIVLYVTHDREEAVRLSSYGRILVMRHGTVCQIGTLTEIVRSPADDYVEAYFKGWLDELKAAGNGAHARKGGV